MASHERCQITLELTPPRKRILKEFRRRHFGHVRISDCEIAAFMATLAFTMPHQLSAACNVAARYRDAEGGVDAVSQITGFVAATWGKVKA